jgi:RHS repeat-associated protein
VNPATGQGVAFTDDCENPNPPPATIAAPEQPPTGKGCGLQNLHYTYDPAGNITHIRDDAQQTVYFRNQRVEPSNDYVYDALYRLLQADGREHLGQGGAPIARSHNDAGRVGLVSADAAGRFAPGDGNAMGTYTERYMFDAVGNFLQMQHRGSHPAHPGWTRAYTYGETSLTEPGRLSNRLSGTQVGNGIAASHETYLHDAHGNMLRMSHLGSGGAGPNMHWDYKDQLRQVDKGGGGAAFYVYNASGQRVRKVWEKAPGLTEERIYLGGFEIFRKHGGLFGADTATLERQTLHVMDDKQRIALVETRTLGDEPDVSQRLIRYQFGNHLGSASLELDEQAQIVSYEEYAPYGSSTYQAVRSQTEEAKRFRYTGKERDEESGLYYHGARYFAPWLGRWMSCDPKGVSDTNDLYVYARCAPTVRTDPDGMQSSPVNTTVSNPLLEKKYQTVSTAQQHRDRTKSTDWGETHANDLSAPVGTSVYAATSGHIVYIVHDARQRHEGPIFGDQVWIRTDDGKIESFYTHIDLTPEILNEIKEKGEEKNGRVSATVNIKIARGAKIGSITTWDTHPNGSHLHFSMAFRKGQKDYQGIDPEQILASTKGAALGRQVSFSDDGSYTVSTQTEPTLPNLPQLSMKLPEFPTFAGISKSGTPRLDLELAPPTMPPLSQAPAIGGQLNVPEVKLTMPNTQFKPREAENSPGYRPKFKPIFQLQAPQ